MSQTRNHTPKSFNRAFFLAFDRTSIFLSVITLLVTSLNFSLFSQLSYLFRSWNYWGVYSLSLGTSALWVVIGLSLMVRRYEFSLERNPITWGRLLKHLPHLVRAAVLLSACFAAFSLLGWSLLGIKHLLLTVPYLGTLLSIAFAWVPFIVLLIFKIFPLLLLLALFFSIPLVSLHGLGVWQSLVASKKLILKFPYESISLFFRGTVFLVVALAINASVYRHTLSYLREDVQTLAWISGLQHLVILLGIIAVLAIPLSIFAHFSVESLKILQKELKENS